MSLASTDLHDARALAIFSNLEPSQAQWFQNNYPGFVPDGWWELTWSEGEEVRQQWQRVQDIVRMAWQRKFPRDLMIKLVSIPTQVFERMIEAAKAGRDIDSGDIVKQSVMVWPYQNAVAFLAAQPWRALFCSSCGQRFAADKPGRRFCSDACTANARKASKLASWHEHKDEWQQRAAKPKGKAKKGRA